MTMQRWIAWFIAIYLAGLMIVFFGNATARADEWDCTPRSEKHVTEHGGHRTDSAWHVANGELPTCGDERRTNDEAKRSSKEAKRSSKDKDDHDKKSRFCRKRWWC
ncbi:membrane protein [Mycobacterium phage SydNat]|nr:membrane protein [Mycobacterium phage SydNat]UVK64376.1 hypothetical protein SEA_GHOULBOY_70 [Mycobacterium phage Ghoulboy]